MLTKRLSSALNLLVALCESSDSEAEDAAAQVTCCTCKIWPAFSLPSGSGDNIWRCGTPVKLPLTCKSPCLYPYSKHKSSLMNLPVRLQNKYAV